MDEAFELLSITDLKAGDLNQALDAVCDLLEDRGMVKESFRNAIKEREKNYPTGINTAQFGVAIPHVDPKHVLKNAVLTVTLEVPVEFGMMGGEPSDRVKVECLLVLLINDLDRHLKTLIKFMKILQNQQDLILLRNARCEMEIRQVLSGYI